MGCTQMKIQNGNNFNEIQCQRIQSVHIKVIIKRSEDYKFETQSY